MYDVGASVSTTHSYLAEANYQRDCTDQNIGRRPCTGPRTANRDSAADCSATGEIEMIRSWTAHAATGWPRMSCLTSASALATTPIAEQLTIEPSDALGVVCPRRMSGRSINV